MALLGRLRALGYDFVAPTPLTHRRVVDRPDKRQARDLRDVFGWSLPFAAGVLPPDLAELLDAAGALVPHALGHKSAVRVARVGAALFLHGAFPTDEQDSVFLGPDTYRFVRMVEAELPRIGPVRRLVDMGAGSGAGGITAAGIVPGARVTLVDSNPRALHLARINAAAAGVEVDSIEGSSLEDVPGALDLVIANPPFIIDGGGPAYRDGGDMLGARLSLDWALAAARRLEPGGHMLLYTGSAIVGGEDLFHQALVARLPEDGFELSYREIDPDIFGGELSAPAYADTERIAAVGVRIDRIA